MVATSSNYIVSHMASWGYRDEPTPVLRMSGNTETDIFYAGLKKVEVVEGHDPITHDEGDEPDDVDGG